MVTLGISVARIAQEQEHDQHHETDADGHRELHVADRGPDRLGPVAEDSYHDRRRQGALKPWQRILYQLDRLIDVVTRLLVHIDDDGPLAIQPCGLTNVFDTVDRLAKVADPDRRPVAIGDDHCIESRRLEDLVCRVKCQRLLAAIQRALRRVDGCGTNGCPDILETKPHRRCNAGVDLHTHGRLLLAMEIDQPDAGNARNLGGDVIFDVVVDLRDRQIGRRDRNRHEQRVGRIDLFIGRWIGQVLGQLPAGRVDRRLHVLRRAVEAAAEVELHLDGSLPERARGAHRGYPRNQRQLPFERRCHRCNHGLRIRPRQLCRYLDGRDIDLRHAGDRQQKIGD